MKIKSTQELLEFGIINIDKCSGPTSFQVSEFVKKKLNLRKTSHFGTLDPKVTGVLPVALNRACKLTGYFLGEDKEYVGIMRIHEGVELRKIKDIIKKKFLGKIKQTPPVKSRVKRQEREREIKSFDILEMQEVKPLATSSKRGQSKGGKDILFKTEVQGGTYIRKLIDDLGKALGIGAHMLELRRIRAGIFTEDNLINLYDFEKLIDNKEELKKIISPAEIVSEIYPAVKVKKEIVPKLLHGSPIHQKDLEKPIKIEKNKIISVFSGENFIGMYKVINEKNIFAKSQFVLQPI